MGFTTKVTLILSMYQSHSNIHVFIVTKNVLRLLWISENFLSPKISIVFLMYSISLVRTTVVITIFKQLLIFECLKVSSILLGKLENVVITEH